MQNPLKLLIERQPWHINDIGVPHPTHFHLRTDEDIMEWQTKIIGSSRKSLISFVGAARPGAPDNIRSILIKQCTSRNGGNCRFLYCISRGYNEPEMVIQLFMESEFCLQPPGDSPTRKSVFDSLISGCIPVFFDSFTAYYQYPWHLSEDHEWYSVFIDKEDVNVREMKVDVVERLMKVSMNERDDMRRYIAYELLLGVRVSIRLCPRNTDDLQFDADFADSVELQPELKRLKLRNNTGTLNLSSTGKTYTVGQLGKDDISQRGMMVRAMEDILKNTSSTLDTVEFSYLQLYLEHTQDLLVPENNNIPIVEDSKTGEIFLPGVEVVKVKDLDHFLQLLQIGEANHHVANTKMNIESSPSHAILMKLEEIGA
ncbi:hypothetical protein GIB67_033420 [Kingdonia uniflora]|uniref:Kinesin motor domain-containing protein n=1 Tax=Kingdonia uniflora TaxID=39325 RepID=A0A7J7LTR3_9MAGN|nr:hypothetical protein GIB67_033420 [Kingdonia uniflora]